MVDTSIPRSLKQYLYSFTELVSAISLLFIMSFTVVSALGRYILGRPIPGNTEIVGHFMMPVLVWFYLPTLQDDEENIAIDIITDRAPKRYMTAIDITYTPVLVLVLGLAINQMGDEALQLFLDGTYRTGAVALPAFFPWAVITIGLVFMTFELLIQFGTRLRKGVE